MTIKEIYYYLFYKFFRLFEAFPTTRWWADWKAMIVVGALEIWFLFSLSNYYDFFLRHHTNLEFYSPRIFLPFIIIILIKWFAFVKGNTWKQYVQEFDKWPKAQNRKGTWIVIGLVVFVIANFVFSFYVNPPPGGFRW